MSGAPQERRERSRLRSHETATVVVSSGRRRQPVEVDPLPCWPDGALTGDGSPRAAVRRVG
ncbi:MAG: hypothetical protein M3N32_03970 [Actinomycetota bacterium]|nr:hypothetical protein [Actinomycetota bacterium]